jgi:hypothetical protein
MRELTDVEKRILKRHVEWLLDEDDEGQANLSGANLSGANLSGANLSWANLSWANLSWAKGIVSVGPIGSRGGMTYAVRHADCVMIQCGCCWGTLEVWEAQCRETHGDSAHGRAYAAAATFIRAHAAAYWSEVES